MTILGMVWGLLAVARAESETSTRPGDYVVLLHGLGRTRLSMNRIERALQRQNYRVINVSYPSTRLSVESAAQQVLAKLLKDEIKDRSVRVHFVTHSLGGIILREYLSSHTIGNLGRVVMLAPPNQGSELADKLRHNVLYCLATGPSGQQLGTDEESVPRRLGPVSFELGVVAGSRSLNPIFSRCLPGLNDGKVSVESTEVNGMRDFLVVPYSHTWMAWRAPVVQSILGFLQTGNFSDSHELTPVPDTSLRTSDRARQM